jgi:hypothetical protein
MQAVQNPNTTIMVEMPIYELEFIRDVFQNPLHGYAEWKTCPMTERDAFKAELRKCIFTPLKHEL